MDAGDRVIVLLALMALQQNRAVDLKVPKSDGSILVTSGNKTAVVKESHTTDL